MVTPNVPVRAYLNHASIGPLQPRVLAAAGAVLADQAATGSGAVVGWLAAIEASRRALGALLGVDPREVALVHSTTEGIQAVARGLPWRRGDGVVVLRGEFPANVLPWLQAAEREGLRVTWLDVADFQSASGDGLARLEAALRQGVRLVAVSAVQFQTGLRMPVAELGALAHAHGSELFVDGIQAVGAGPLDLTHVDYLAAGGHKWLMAPMGSGLLWARAAQWAALRPAVAGWLSAEDPVRFLFGEPGRLQYDKPWQVGPAAVEGAARSFVGHIALGVAAEDAVAQGPARVFAHVQPMLDDAEQVLQEAGWASRRATEPERRSCILALRPPPDVDLAGLAARAAEQGIVLSTPDGHLRISPSWSTDPQDCAWAVRRLAALTRA